jgi:GAF domain-containing protein
MSFSATPISTDDKQSFYNLLIKQVEGLLSVESNLIANAANLSSLLYHSMPEINWVGFYFYVESQKELVLGPFHGQVACTRIPIGQGVCGIAFEKNQTLRIEDVHAFKGHIACDTASNSELVIPLNINGKIIGVLDIDSPVLDRFDSLDEKACVQIADIYCKSLNSESFNM